MYRLNYLVLFAFLLCYIALGSLTLSKDEIIIEFSEKDSIIAKNIIESFSNTIFQFQKKIGQYPNLPVEIILTANDSDYFYLEKKSKIIEFSNAHYNPKTGKIYIRNPRKNSNFLRLNQILLHEYIHHFVGYYWNNPPLWFNEGMAVYFSDDLSFDREMNFIKNYVFGNSRPLSEMRNKYPKNRIEWESFYAKSALAVKYIYKNNKTAFFEFWDSALPRRDFEQSFRLNFLTTTNDFSIFFEEYSAKHFKIEILLASSSILWGFLPLVLLVGWIRKKIKIRNIEKGWREEEMDQEKHEEEKEELE